MLILIHGEDTTASREKLQEEKERFKETEVRELDGRKLTLPELVLACEASSILFAKKLVIIENLFQGGDRKEKQPLIDYLTCRSSPHPVILWEEKQLPKTLVAKYFTSAKEVLFKFPPLLFQFLDSIGRVSPTLTISNFHLLLSREEPAFLLAMMLRQWRNLIIAKDLGFAGFSGQPRWQVEKYLRQAQKFSLAKLIEGYRQLLTIDYRVKTGQTPYSLGQLLDIFLANL